MAQNATECLGRGPHYLRQQVELLARLYDASSDEAIFVPDTNALLYNPNMKHGSSQVCRGSP